MKQTDFNFAFSTLEEYMKRVSVKCMTPEKHRKRFDKTIVMCSRGLYITENKLFAVLENCKVELQVLSIVSEFLEKL